MQPASALGLGRNMQPASLSCPIQDRDYDMRPDSLNISVGQTLLKLRLVPASRPLLADVDRWGAALLRQSHQHSRTRDAFLDAGSPP